MQTKKKLELWNQRKKFFSTGLKTPKIYNNWHLEIWPRLWMLRVLVPQKDLNQTNQT